MRVGAKIQVSAPARVVWAFVEDPARSLHLMSGVTRWEVAEGAPATGLGARYKVLMRVGSAEVGGTIEVVESSAPADLAWTSITGIDQRGRWRIRERELDRTDVELRLSYGVAGAGPLGWLAERVAAPTVRANVRRTLQQLKRQVEHEQLRQAAARRREARTA
ncbi:MAG TPA: SRPBCC family protein [Solirubrobacteraceae bacterium]|nr:SRPBCC family protein [Solirubrobacteraceae bacterium]